MRKPRTPQHGHARRGQWSPTYNTWKAMMGRAYHGHGKDWPRYLARGIEACERWAAFENFLADMGERPAGTTLDRIDNARGYEPSNCRWATYGEQSTNRRNARLITAFGRTQHISQWARELGAPVNTIVYRLSAGWPPEEAVSQKPTMSRKFLKRGERQAYLAQRRKQDAQR